MTTYYNWDGIVIDEKSLPPDHSDLATHLNNLAGLYYSQGNYGDRISTALKLNPDQDVDYNHDQNFVKNTL